MISCVTQMALLVYCCSLQYTHCKFHVTIINTHKVKTKQTSVTLTLTGAHIQSHAIGSCSKKLRVTLTCLINEQIKPCLLNKQGDIFVINNKRTSCILPNKQTYRHNTMKTISKQRGSMPNKNDVKSFQVDREN